MERRVYYWMVSIGGILSLSMLMDLFDIPESLSIICAFLSMIGGGVLCSALVSFLIEKQNEARNKKQKMDMREYSLKSVKHDFERLCEREFAQLSCYYSRYILGREDKFQRESFSIATISRNVYMLLSEIENNEDDKRKETTEIIISMETLEFEEKKKYHLMSANLPYYKAMLQSLVNLSSDFALFLSSGVFSDKDIEELKSFTSDIQDVLTFSSDIEMDDGTILVMKGMIYEKAADILILLNIPADTTISCQYKPIN